MSYVDEMLDNVKAAAESMQERIDELEGELDDMEADRDYWLGRAEELSEELDEATQSISREELGAVVKVQTKHLTSEIDDLKAQLAEVEE